MNFSAVILAGGKSSRMGCDKAFVELEGQTLLARQIQRVRNAGAAEVFISGRDGVDYSACGALVVKDQFNDAGPLAGIQSALLATLSSWLLVLAVDLPEISEELLAKLVANCLENAGVVPRVGGNIEPLAAIYPKAALPLATFLLSQNMFAVKKFAELCERPGLISFMDLPATASKLFLNCNSRAELELMGRRQTS